MRKRKVTAASRDAYPRKATCPGCRAPILAGRYDALEIVLDPFPLNRLGEIDARTQGRRTYFLTERHISRRPKRPGNSTLGGRLLREHRCMSAPPGILALDVVLPPDPNEPCPF